MVGDYTETRVNLSMGTPYFPSNHWFFNKMVEYQELLCVVVLLVSLYNHKDDDENMNNYRERNWFNKQNKYFECTAHFLYISFLSSHIIHIVI